MQSIKFVVILASGLISVFVILSSEVDGRRYGVVTAKLFDIKCNNSLSKSAVNTTCNLKSYSRTNTVMNLHSFLKRPIHSDNVKIRLTIHYRVRTVFRKYMDHTVQDFCGLMKGGQNIFLDRMILDAVRLADPKILHPCPYYGHFGWTNFSLNLANDTKDSVLPRGDYLYHLQMSDDFDPHLANLKLYIAINSDVEL